MLKNTKGTWIQIASIEIVDIFCDTSLDWICFDLEHGMITTEFLRAAVPLVSARNKKVVLRVLHADSLTLRRYLDLGVDALILPNVRNANQVSHLKKELSYPPIGTRGIGFCRFNRYGQTVRESLSSEPVLIAQIESKSGLAALDDLIDLDLFGGFMLGPYDLSGSLGVCGEFQSEIYQSAIAEFITKCKLRNKLIGQHIVKLEQLDHESMGDYDFVALGLDTDFLTSSARSLDEICKSSIGS